MISPGPYTILEIPKSRTNSSHQRIISGADGRQICIVYGSSDTARDNANLIKQSFLLRAAAWSALEELLQWQGLDEDDEGTQEAIADLREALECPEEPTAAPGAEMDWNDTSDPRVREAEADERADVNRDE